MKNLKAMIVLVGIAALAGCTTFSNKFEDRADGTTIYESSFMVPPLIEMTKGMNDFVYDWTGEKGLIKVGSGVDSVDPAGQVAVSMAGIEMIMAGFKIAAMIYGMPVPLPEVTGPPPAADPLAAFGPGSLRVPAPAAPKSKHNSTKPPHQRLHSHNGGDTHHKHKAPHDAGGGHHGSVGHASDHGHNSAVTHAK